MKTRKLNKITVLGAVFALAGCSTTHTAGYSHNEPIMSAADARSMIRVEVHTIDPAPAEQELVAATDWPQR